MNHKFFLLFSFIFLAFGPVSAQNEAFLADYLEKWENSKLYSLELIDSMPGNKLDFQPTEDEMSFKKLTLHLLQNMIWLSSDYLDGGKFEHNLKDIDPSKEELLDLVSQAYDFSINAVKGLSPHLLNTKVEFFAGPMTTRKILFLMDDHATHHRGQLGVYLRINNIKPPRYKGW